MTLPDQEMNWDILLGTTDKSKPPQKRPYKGLEKQETASVYSGLGYHKSKLAKGHVSASELAIIPHPTDRSNLDFYMETGALWRSELSLVWPFKQHDLRRLSQHLRTGKPHTTLQIEQ